MDKIKKWIVPILIIILVTMFFPLDSGMNRLGRGFVLFDNEPCFISYQNMRDSVRIDIPPRILSYKNSLNCLLIKQCPERIDNALFPHYHYPYGRDTVYYWFIDKRKKKVTGPLRYDEMQSFLKGCHKERMLIGLHNKD